MTFTQLPHPEVIACTDSTNRQLAERFDAGSLQAFAPLVARHQLSGRGRLGHRWFAPVDSSLLFSTAITLPDDVPAENLGWISLISSLAVAELIENELGPDAAITIKWPNDVLLGDRKVCGILTQYLGQRGGLHWAIVGVGLNLTQSEAELDRLGATSLSQHGWAQHGHVTEVLARLAEDLNDRLYDLTRDLDASSAAYEAACSTLGQTVTATPAQGNTVSGQAVGLTAEGGLQVDTGTEIITVTAGEVTLGNRPGALPTGREVFPSTTCEECK